MNILKYKKINQDSFMSLSKIACGYRLSPQWALEKWLSEPTTLEFIQLWECLHNTQFKKDNYINLCTNSLSCGAAPEISELQNQANVSCIFMDKDPDGQVFVHKDIAIDFASWASPAFRTFCLLNMQNQNIENTLRFNSEEDFIISTKTLAEHTKQQALEQYKIQMAYKETYPAVNTYKYFSHCSKA